MYIKNKNQGFTLIELLIVIGIIAILAAAVIITITPGERLEDAREVTRESHLSAIGTAVHLKTVDDAVTIQGILDHANCGSGTNVLATAFDDACAEHVGLGEAPVDPSSEVVYQIGVDSAGDDRIIVWTTETSDCCGPNQAGGKTF